MSSPIFALALAQHLFVASAFADAPTPPPAEVADAATGDSGTDAAAAEAAAAKIAAEIEAKLAAGQELSPDEIKLMVRGFESQLSFQQGNVILGDGIAALNTPAAFRFLGPQDAAKVVYELWGNPPGPAPLGMLVPAEGSLADDDNWGVIISYEEDGHVSDEDAADIDYDELLEDMQESTLAENDERREQGYPAVTLVGWATPPHFDQSTHKLYWAKELAFEGNEQHTLNYAIRVLGRKGVLELNAVSDMGSLAKVQGPMEQIVGAVDFQTGNRYTDFDPDIDEVAAYGIAGLIAGKMAMNAGFFKMILAALLAGKKFVIAGLIALGLLLKKMFGAKNVSEGDE